MIPKTPDRETKSRVVSSPLSPINDRQTRIFNENLAPIIVDMTKEDLQFIVLKIKDHIHEVFDLGHDNGNKFMQFCGDVINEVKSVADKTNRDVFLSAIRTPSRDTSDYLECLVAFQVVYYERHRARNFQATFLKLSMSQVAPSWLDVCGKVFKPSVDKGVDLVVIASGKGDHGMHVTYIQVKHGTTKHGYTDVLKTNKFALSTIRYRLRMGRYAIEALLQKWFPERYSSYVYDYCLYTSAPVINAINKDYYGIRKPPAGGTEIVIYDRSGLADAFNECGIASALENDLGIFENC